MYKNLALFFLLFKDKIERKLYHTDVMFTIQDYEVALDY